MKRMLLLLSLVSVFSLTSYGQMTPERKYIVLKDVEGQVFRLGFELDTMRNHIYPAIVDKRTLLAPHYPDITTIERTIEARTTAFHNWIGTYPDEYDAYSTYLTFFISSNL